jgi:hypothetical protein
VNPIHLTISIFSFAAAATPTLCSSGPPVQQDSSADNRGRDK